MGAFGELLIQYFGGNLDYYRGNHKSIPSTPEIDTVDNNMKHLADDPIQSWKLRIAREWLDRLTTSIIYKFTDIADVTEESFRKGYKSINTEEWVIDIMWDEYQNFKTKYIKT